MRRPRPPRRRHRHRPLIVGLTGSIGMGKSTVAAMLRRERVPLFDADAEVHRLQGAGSPVLPALAARFPAAVTSAGVDRIALGQAVFADAAARADLEALVYPALAEVRTAFLRRHRSRAFVVLDVPLLFEKGGWRLVDRIVVVSAPPATQARRVLRRPGMTRAKFAAIRALQWPDAVKRGHADIVIPTGGSLHATRTAVRRLVACLSAGARA